MEGSFGDKERKTLREKDKLHSLQTIFSPHPQRRLTARKDVTLAMSMTPLPSNCGIGTVWTVPSIWELGNSSDVGFYTCA